MMNAQPADAWKGPQHRLNLSPSAWRQLQARYADQLSRVRPTLRMTLGVSARYLGWLEGLQNRRSGSTSSTVRPVFILGHWRSGTTLLHELLAQDERFAYPTTYACMNPQHFLLTERGALELSGVRRVERPMDGMQVSTVSPQEDEFALLCLGARSPYEAALFPAAFARAMRTTRWDTLDADEQQQWMELTSRFLGQLASRAGTRTLLLKSPPHLYRVPALARLYPDARFVAIVRDPVAVASSTRRMWLDLATLYALTPPPHAPAFSDIAAALGDAGRTLAQASSESAAWHTVRYEDLVDDPHATLEGIYAKLDLGDYGSPRPAIEAYLQRTSAHRSGRHQLDANEQALLRAACGDLFTRYGYKL